MKLDRVLVVYKKSLYQIYVSEHHDPSVERAIDRDDPVAARLERSHRAQETAMRTVVQTLKRRGIACEYRWRGRIRSTKGFDLVIAVGGDGTVLDTAYRIRDGTALLGINSDPSTSVGYLCGGTAGQLDALLTRLEDGGSIRRRVRLRVRIDGETVLGPCLNDVLVAHRSPAEMSRFEMARLPADQAEAVEPASRQTEWLGSRSSGVWVCTPTGSTGGMRSAGGKVMPPASRRLQYLVREPYVAPDRPHPPGDHGFVAEGQALVVVSRMRAARLWGDGPHRSVDLHYGQKVVVDRHPSSLPLVS